MTPMQAIELVEVVRKKLTGLSGEQQDELRAAVAVLNMLVEADRNKKLAVQEATECQEQKSEPTESQ